MKKHPEQKLLNSTGGSFAFGKLQSLLLFGVGALNFMRAFLFVKYPRA